MSQIPLLRSFRFDKHVAESTMLSKCILRLAVEDICKLDNVYYFPSFETAMYPGHGNNNVFIGASAGEIQIGNNVLIGPNTVIRSSNHNFKKESYKRRNIKFLLDQLLQGSYFKKKFRR